MTDDPKARLARIEQVTKALVAGLDCPRLGHGTNDGSASCEEWFRTFKPKDAREFIAMARTEIPWLVEEVKRLRVFSLCGVCGGFPNDHPSGLPCICGGSGLAMDEGANARVLNHELTERAEKAEAEVKRVLAGCWGPLATEMAVQRVKLVHVADVRAELATVTRRAEKAEAEVQRLRAATTHPHDRTGVEVPKPSGIGMFHSKQQNEIAEDGEPVIMPLDEIDSFARRMLYEHGDQRPWMALPVVCNTARAAHALKAEVERLTARVAESDRLLADLARSTNVRLAHKDTEIDGLQVAMEALGEQRDAARDARRIVEAERDAARALSERRNHSLEVLMSAARPNASHREPGAMEHWMVPMTSVRLGALREAKAAYDAEEMP